MLYIAESWGGVAKHKPLLDNILRWPGKGFAEIEASTNAPTLVSRKDFISHASTSGDGSRNTKKRTP